MVIKHLSSGVYQYFGLWKILGHPPLVYPCLSANTLVSAFFDIILESVEIEGS